MSWIVLLRMMATSRALVHFGGRMWERDGTNKLCPARCVTFDHLRMRQRELLTSAHFGREGMEGHAGSVRACVCVRHSTLPPMLRC